MSPIPPFLNNKQKENKGDTQEENMKKGVYVFPAVFTALEDGKYEVVFPDLEGCYTFGDDLNDAIKMAEDVLALTLYDYETDKMSIPEPSDRKAIDLNADQFVNYIAADTLEYRKRFNNKAVKKTLTIPEWMNEAATEAGINFSQILQEALAQKLNLV